jgi:hypothetical protein
MKFLDNENLLFFINKTAPYIMYAIKLEVNSDLDKELDMQEVNKRFSCIYEISLAFPEKLIDPIDFD